MKKFFVSVLEIGEIALIAIVSVFLIRTFLVQPFLVSGMSMVPNFSDGDYLLIDELTYRIRPAERGEVVVFHNPQDESVYFIKRVIGLPGETVNIKDNKVYISKTGNGGEKALVEKYLPAGMATTNMNNVSEFKLGPNQYFALGDNRPYSFDSRGWGVLESKEIVGLVRLRLWPIDTLKAFAAPQYGI